MDWNVYLATLRPKGRLHFVGAVLEPLQLALFPMILGQYNISGSPVGGGPDTIRTMLDFAVQHLIQPIVQFFQFDQVNEAIKHLKNGSAHYRIVLSHKS